MEAEMFYYDELKLSHRLIRKSIIFVLSLIFFILLWWDISLIVNTAVIPTPLAAVEALIRLFQQGDIVSGYSMLHHIWISLQRFLIGLLIAIIIAVPFGLIIGSSKSIKDFTAPIIEILRPIAPIAWAPILVFAIGYSWGPIAVVVIGIFFPLLTNTIFGVQKIDKVLVDAARTMGANKTQIFGTVTFPCAVPYMMNGIRIGSGIGWMCIVASELYASSGGGIGYFVGLQASIGFWPNVYAGIIVIAVLGIMTTVLFEYIYKFAVRRMGME